MAADFQPIALAAHVIGVVNHPDGEPEHFLLERLEILEARRGNTARTAQVARRLEIRHHSH